MVALIKFIISKRLPMTLVDEPSFQSLLNMAQLAQLDEIVKLPTKDAPKSKVLLRVPASLVLTGQERRPYDRHRLHTRPGTLFSPLFTRIPSSFTSDTTYTLCRYRTQTARDDLSTTNTDDRGLSTTIGRASRPGPEKACQEG
ncbi:unnamed protein product [Mortierella alpina]